MQVVSKIFEAYDNFIATGAKNYKITPKGTYEFIGFTKEGIQIEIHMTKNGVINTARPVLGDII
jgi:hypothetical protein